MALDSLERSTPRLFHRGPSPLTQLGIATVVAVFLMLADSRFQVGNSVRAVVATVLAPLQWLSAQPVKSVNLMGDYVTTLDTARQSQEQAAMLIAQQALKAQRAELLQRENEQLRQMLSLPAEAA